MSDALKDAQELYCESIDAQRDQRKQIEEDLRFSDPSDPQQWDEKVKSQRENDPGGVRPCLVMDQTGQYVANVAGQIEKQPPAIHAIPVGGGADKQAAEQIDGRFRHIEHASRAAQHYARALTSAARAGVGYLVIRPEYVDRALGWQEPRIGSEPDPLKVVFDPWSVETDGSDSDFGFILNDMSLREFERRWNGKDRIDFGDTATSFKRDDRKSILIAEQFLKETSSKNVLVYQDAQGQETSGSEEEYFAACQAAGQVLPFLRNYTDKAQVVKWRRMSGADVLEESIYLADSIGIVPVYGYIGFSDGRMNYCGIPRRARHAQQSYNYHVSEQHAYIGAAPKSPWLASKRATAGVEQLWDRASTQSRAWLPYNDLDEMGAIAQPTRINPSVSMMNHAEGAAQALRDIQASIGMYQANLGAQSNETSGVAIESRKQQGEASTAHFPAHMAASLGQVGNIIMQMDARLSDTQRKQPIIGIDGSAGSVSVNPDQQEAFKRMPNGGGVSINPSVGKYGVRVVVGASYSTQRTQTNAAFAEIMRGNKDLAATVAPFWAQTLDFPGSDKFAQAMAAMAPAPIKAILQPEGQEDAPDPAKMAQQISEMQKALQEAIQHAHDAQQDADEAISAAADAKRIAEVKERELDIKAYDSETKRLQVAGAADDQVKAIVNDLIQTMLDHPDPLPGDKESYEPEPVQQEQGEAMPDPNEERHNKMMEMMQGLHQKIDQSNQMETHLVRDPVTGKASHTVKRMPQQIEQPQEGA